MIKIDIYNKVIEVPIPLTRGTEKIRIKKRNDLNEYGEPVSTKKEPFSQNCYVEWQIGYDVYTQDDKKLANTSLPNVTFIGANKKTKALYELSEYIKYFYDWKIVSEKDLLDISDFLKGLSDNDFLDNCRSCSELAITRSTPKSKKINSISFCQTKVEYPLLIHKFGDTEIVAEIIIKEKQYAIGVQPMLYLCFPITKLDGADKLLGKTANTKEKGIFIIDRNNIGIFIETLKIFGTLSKNHNHDVLEIISTIINN